MVWDITTPLGTEAVSNGDDRIRELKEDVQTALRGDDADGVEAKFPGSDTANPVFRYRGLKGTTGARPAAGQYGLYFDQTRNALQRDNGSSWDDIATVIPVGTATVFYQAAAPIGWTKIVTQDDKALRVVSGTGGSSGGTLPMSGGVSHSHTVTSHTHTFSATTSTPSATTTADAGVNAAIPLSTHTHTVSGTSGAAAPTTDTQAPVLAYIDVLLCSKD